MRYSGFLLEDIMRSLWKVLKSQTLLNGEGFGEEFDGLLKCKEQITQMPKVKKYATK